MNRKWTYLFATLSLIFGLHGVLSAQTPTATLSFHPQHVVGLGIGRQLYGLNPMLTYEFNFASRWSVVASIGIWEVRRVVRKRFSEFHSSGHFTGNVGMRFYPIRFSNHAMSGPFVEMQVGTRRIWEIFYDAGDGSYDNRQRVLYSGGNVGFQWIFMGRIAVFASAGAGPYIGKQYFRTLLDGRRPEGKSPISGWSASMMAGLGLRL